MELLIFLFWTSGDIYLGFQRLDRSLPCMFPGLRTIDYSDSQLTTLENIDSKNPNEINCKNRD